MSTTFSGVNSLTKQNTWPAHRNIEAARRRAVDARRRADRNPIPANLERADELEAGLVRMEAEARA